MCVRERKKEINREREVLKGEEISFLPTTKFMRKSQK